MIRGVRGSSRAECHAFARAMLPDTLMPNAHSHNNRTSPGARPSNSGLKQVKLTSGSTPGFVI